MICSLAIYRLEKVGSMNYGQFVNGITWTRAQWAIIGKKKNLAAQRTSYEILRSRGDNYWLHLEKLNAIQLGNEIISGFLNTPEWSCHLDKPSSKNGKAIIQNLKSVLNQLPPYYDTLANQRIETLDFKARTVINIGTMPVLFVVSSIYSLFRQIKPRFGPVPSSKILHMAVPNLFMMWDNAIFKNYGVPRDLFGYRSYIAFLVLMQQSVQHIKESFSKGLNISYQNLCKHINNKFGYKNLPITRLLDIANYAIGGKNIGAPDIDCPQCIEKANLILDGLENDQNTSEMMRVVKIRRYRH